MALLGKRSIGSCMPADDVSFETMARLSDEHIPLRGDKQESEEDLSLLSLLIDDVAILEPIEKPEDGPVGPALHSPLGENEPAERYMNLMLYQAVNDHATDVYFELTEKGFKVDYMINGTFYDMQTPPRRLFPSMEGILGQMFGFTETRHIIKNQTWLQEFFELRRTVDSSIEVEKEDIPYEEPLELECTIASTPMKLTLTRESAEYATKYHITFSNDLSIG